MCCDCWTVIYMSHVRPSLLLRGFWTLVLDGGTMETVTRLHLCVSTVCCWLALIAVSILSLLTLHTDYRDIYSPWSGLLSRIKAINSKLSVNFHLSKAIWNMVWKSIQVLWELGNYDFPDFGRTTYLSFEWLSANLLFKQPYSNFCVKFRLKSLNRVYCNVPTANEKMSF